MKVCQRDLNGMKRFSGPIISFGETKFSVNEPKEKGQVSVVKIPVLRVGDTAKVSVVRVHTKDGSATSGEDYHPISEGKYYSQLLFIWQTAEWILLENICQISLLSPAEIVFKQGDTEHYVEVEVLYDGIREMREAFTVHLRPDENMVAETKVKLNYHNFAKQVICFP